MSLTAYTGICKAIGGVKTLWLADAADVTSMTLGSGVQTYDTITMETAKVFTAFGFDRDQCNFKVTAKTENGAIAYDIAIEVKTRKVSDTLRTAIVEIATLAECGVIAVVQDNNSQYHVFGYNETEGKRGLMLTGLELGSGNTLTDHHGGLMTLTADTAYVPRLSTIAAPTS